MKRRTERSASEEYAVRRASIDAKIERLRAVLTTLDAWHRDRPADWAVVGDAGAVDAALSDILVGCEAAEIWQREWSGRKGGGA